MFASTRCNQLLLAMFLACMVSLSTIVSSVVDLCEQAVKVDCTPEGNPLCTSCNNNVCDQCSGTNFFLSPEKDNCLPCDIPGCKFCAKDNGCQQCIDSTVEPFENSCGIKICIAEEEDTLAPTAQPTLGVQEFEFLVDEYFNGDLTPEEIAAFVTDDYFICLHDIACGGVELLIKLGTMCENGANALFNQFTPEMVINAGEFWFQDISVCCDNSDHPDGTFWLNYLVFYKYNSEGVFTEEYWGLKPETDIEFIRDFILSSSSV